ncbi:MAG: thioredoxin family protein [Acidimicrobiia bacterium]
MELTVLYIEGCPHLDVARARLAEALVRTGVEAAIGARLVRTEAEAVGLSFAGSPTILVDGRDPFPARSAGLACRLYATDAGPDGAPTVEALVEVILDRAAAPR